MPNCVIGQPAGLGDIIFCQKIADMFIQNGYTVWWPVVEQYYDDVNKYMKKEGLIYCREQDDFPLKEYYYSSVMSPTRKADSNDVYLPLQHADKVYPKESILQAKYKLLRVSHSDWSDYFSFTRDREKENSLYEELGLSPEKQYCLVNRWFGTPPDSQMKKMDITEDYQIVEMRMIGGYSVFDWTKVIEGATVIYSVDTVINYIMEKMKIRARCELFSRYDPANWNHIDGLFSIAWNYND